MGSPPDLFAFYYKEVFTGKEVVYNKKYHFTQGENNEGESMEKCNSCIDNSAGTYDRRYKCI